MSKAFDCVDRKMLIEDLKNIVDQDELHILKILIEDVTLQVKNSKKTGEKFITNVGVPQGDCLSPILFTFYLAQALKSEEIPQDKDHTYAKRGLPQDIDHNYAKSEEKLLIDMQYADDINWNSASKEKIEEIENKIPQKLEKRKLIINKDKTEKYTLGNKEDESWKSCKYLGSVLDTEKDIVRRKQLGMSAFKQYQHILQSKKILLEARMRLFDTYVSSIFLYNSELWTLTKTLSNTIDIFHRNLLRKVLKVKWPYVIKNEKLYSQTKEIKWTARIKGRRMRFLGHFLRLPENCPAKLAFNECNCKTIRERGANKKTLLKLYNEDLKTIDSNLNLQDRNIFYLAQDRNQWRDKVVNRSTAMPTIGVVQSQYCPEKPKRSNS